MSHGFFVWNDQTRSLDDVGSREHTAYAQDEARDYVDGRNDRGVSLQGTQTLEDSVSQETLELMQRLGLR